MNTVEQLVMFLPSLWLCTVLVAPLYASVMGGAWVVGRLMYAQGYYKAAASRGPGFGITSIAQLCLLFGCALGLVQ